MVRFATRCKKESMKNFKGIFANICVVQNGTMHKQPQTKNVFPPIFYLRFQTVPILFECTCKEKHICHKNWKNIATMTKFIEWQKNRAR